MEIHYIHKDTIDTAERADRIPSELKLGSIPALTDGRGYLYVLENEDNIKIGFSADFGRRLQSLSGSNSGGKPILRCAVSQPTWIYRTLERLAHQRFDNCRVDGEWFKITQGPDGVTFKKAMAYVDSLFMRKDYRRCNEARCNYEKSRRLHIEYLNSGKNLDTEDLKDTEHSYGMWRRNENESIADCGETVPYEGYKISL